MRLRLANIRNYRTLESVDLSFPSLYAAICGANDCGKTNVVRALRALVRGELLRPFRFVEESELSPKDDYPKWKDTEPSKQEISFEIILELDKTRDIGFYQFVVTQLKRESPADLLTLELKVTYQGGKVAPTVVVTTEGTTYSGLDAQQVLTKLQSSRSILFHNSTDIDRTYYPRRSVTGEIREITGQHESLVESMKKTVSRGLAKISKSQQAEFEGLLGRLQTKYKVGLSLPPFDFGYLPFSITLGDKKVEVPLDDLGSGTKNRTLILLALFRARQMGESDPSASKITPVLVIEEPESFLHPAAQAEFGRVLQDMAEEFKVQVIVTTHSPYLLNLKDPSSNILLSRHTSYNQLRETERVETTGDNWMAPFGIALGLDTEEFKPWKDMMLGSTDSILLVEGDTDKKYLEMLRDAKHGSNRLVLHGDIVSYEGTGSLSNTVLLRFIKNRHRKVFVTFDLDAVDRVEKTLKGLKLEKKKHYLPIGHNVAGKRNIEGLLPESVTKGVYKANASLVQAATAGTKEEQESAKRKLKTLLFDEFEKQATPGVEFFGGFYSVVKVINKAVS
jgi:putative ATP-dependent endonuclease of OLD family